jgi:hypothetical protein
MLSATSTLITRHEQHYLTGGPALMTPRTYEITFAGEAVPAIVSAFEDFDVIVGGGNTTVRAELADQAALHGALDRMRSLGLELLQVTTVEPPRP